MLRISSVWRIRQIKNFKNSLKNASILYLFFEIYLALNSYNLLYYEQLGLKRKSVWCDTLDILR